MVQRFLQILLLGLILLSNPFLNTAGAQVFISGEERVQRRAEKRLDEASLLFMPWKHLGSITLDSISVQRESERVQLFFSPALTHIPIRHHWLQYLENELMNMLGWRFRNYQLELFARGRHLYEFIPNIFREEHYPEDSLRIRIKEPVPPLVRRVAQPNYEQGLRDNHIALWHSHGYYYDTGNDRWQWQRARLFGTIEDMLTMEYVVKYITPMLENAGANVFLPRERDIQTNEVIVDSDSSNGGSEVLFHHGDSQWEINSGGFALQDTLFKGDNPFRIGTHLHIPSNSGGILEYIPGIPEDGYYAVYVSWAESPDNIADALYEVHYAGGNASFRVNQQMGYGTWIYLGQFYFARGKNRETGSVVLYTDSEESGIVTADAVRFGGGLGNVARRASAGSLPNRRSVSDTGNSTSNQTGFDDDIDATPWKLSESPRFVEGSRYYLQYAGMPDTLVYSLNEEKNDYNDDYMSRGEWVNYLLGAPLGPGGDRNVKGLNIPIDLSLAFHTDAGITPSDSVIGTLAIYSAQRDDGLFPDGVSRLSGRDLSDIIQDQLVSDIRALVNQDWTRRALWDRQYSEAWRPNVPAMLLELYSHQNLADVIYGLDPRYQFITSRAIYKGILRYLAHSEGREAVVQPLPPDQFAIHLTEGKRIRLSWQPVEDSLEPSAAAQYFKIYQREEGQGFDQGFTTTQNHIDFELSEWSKIYSFKVTAINSGGESFPSETLSVAVLPGQSKTVLIVNGFDRISGPGTFDTGDMAGVSWWDDLPVPYLFSASTTGMQYDFRRHSPWLDDDSPGWGASYGDIEKQIVPGNTYDYPSAHGSSIMNAGYSFVSVSRKAFENQPFNPDEYFAINLLMGKQKGVPSWPDNDSIVFRVFTDPMIDKLISYAKTGGNILLSGAYVGTDMILHNDKKAMDFAEEYLGYTWRTNNASNTGDVYPTNAAISMNLQDLAFNTGLHPELYAVEAPDAIEAAGDNSAVVYRYLSNKTSAAVSYSGQHKAFTLGFPFESVIKADQRDALMKRILFFFENNK
jgi:hypothetical protein